MVNLAVAAARRIWLRAQRLDTPEAFGGGPGATLAAIEHLGYVQIDSINVIERAHHHILWTRIPAYRRSDVYRAQTVDKTVFETWTHALSYVPTADFKYFAPAMRDLRTGPWLPWNKGVTAADVRAAVNRIRENGPLKISEIKDDVLKAKPAVRALIDERVRRGELVPVVIGDARRAQHWATPETLETVPDPVSGMVHLISPFDPLVILRKRLELFFGYTHLFEAYVPEEKRVFGYFGLPVLVDDEIVAVIDLKADRTAGTMLIRQWTWVGTGNDHAHRQRIEDALARFEEFQLNRTPSTTCIAGVSRTAYVPATPHPFD